MTARTVRKWRDRHAAEGAAGLRDRTGRSSKRGTGWEYLHVAIDDASRLAFTAMLPDEREESAVMFLDATL
ncbi:MAG: hypothetical protein K2X46_07920, partial [Roseomonas sp.]|nr:hypothetical protein [Roseomonas sp.]